MSDRVISNNKKNRTENQILLAQYFTPQSIAQFMTTMFKKAKSKSDIKVLDPGAGEGMLGISLVQSFNNKKAKSTFIELDENTFKKLSENIDAENVVSAELINDDFINAALELEAESKRFTHIILNPPYFKLNVNSAASKKLRIEGIKVTNIYAAFMWLSARLLDEGGEMVAIIPRSFCNGPYFESFRQYISSGYSINHIHLFDSRNKAFSEDKVLQENIIISISKEKQAETVIITSSSDQQFKDVATRNVNIVEVLKPTDKSKIIHIPEPNQGISLTDFVNNKLQDLDLMVSTGPIVDFRSKEFIKSQPSKVAIPLLYPSHISGHKVIWPSDTFKKQGQYYIPPNNKQVNLGVEKILHRTVLPLDGYYVIVRRFSSKEEKRRIFAAIVEPERINRTEITFENHLNYFHLNRHGLDKKLAFGLCAYLNSSLIDTHFRRFSGHTQVNVTDLKNLPYPNTDTLRKLGEALNSVDTLMDDIVNKEILGKVSRVL